MKKIIKNFIQGFFIKFFGLYLVKFPKYKHSVDCAKTIEVLLKYHTPKVLCDIGSNSGDWAKALADMSKQPLNHVSFFEPQAKYQNILQNIDLKGAERVLFQCGLGNEETKLTISGGNSCASFLDFDKSKTKDFVGSFLDETETVDVKILDKLYKEHKMPAPDVIKFDVQGYELYVLQGAKETIAKAKYIIIELSMESFYLGQPKNSEILAFLENHNYVLIDFGFQWRVDYDENKRIIQIDGIFANSAIL
jgi:FkbM family methyltransferase